MRPVLLCQLLQQENQRQRRMRGEKLFTQQCAVCHPQGGNIINPRKTLSKKILAANNIKTEADIIKIMRNGAAGMTKFDATAISDEDAKMIARYILGTFK